MHGGDRDLATDNDAERLSRADIPVVQITTGTMSSGRPHDCRSHEEDAFERS
ncbi:MAG: hypothetical protein ACLT8E_04140 [Akkermansia sp.]